MSGRENPGSIFRFGAHAAALLWLLIAGGASAGTVYKCVNAGGALAFQATPCAAEDAQTAVEIREQPLIDAKASPSSVDVVRPAAGGFHIHRASSRERSRNRTTPDRLRASQATSWECRAADGEVFYRHTRCPHSVPGDGVMRSGGTYALGRGRGGRTRARSAWDPVPVHARKVSRSEACRRINAIAAVERDGSMRDEHVSAYDHDLGRDPCSGH